MKHWPHIPFEPDEAPLLPRARSFALIIAASALFGLGWAKTERLLDWPTAPAQEMPVAP